MRTGEPTKEPRAARVLLWAMTGLIIPLVLAGLARGSVVAGEPPPPEPDELGPAQVVNRFHATLVQTMKAGHEAGFAGRYELLEPVVKDSFDLKMIARTVLGAHGRKLEAAQRALFLDTFTRFTISSYASRFDTHSGERFDFVSEKAQREDLRIVRTRFIDAKGKKRDFDYQLMRINGRWRQVNVAVDGVSDLSLKRAEYTDVIEREGFASLIRILKESIDEMSRADDGKL